MIYLIYADFKDKMDKLVEVIDSCKLEMDELRAPSYPDTSILNPFNPTRVKALKDSTRCTTHPPLATFSLNTATSALVTVANKERKNPTVPSKVLVMAKAPTTTPKPSSKKDPTLENTTFLLRGRAHTTTHQHWP
ncbi:hypothetical protein HOY80DRAFT_1034445 [Tuber brumale]|nr:hypothetical protein HOY80DRAFT_1034445 [Tuber brumale]